jgi:protein SCO1
MKPPVMFFAGLLTGLLAFSCTKKDTPIDVVTFPLRGEVVGVDTARGRVVIAHEEIPNYMPAMTMPFKVKNPALLRGLAPGDSVGATLAVSRTESWLEAIAVLQPGEQITTVPADRVQLTRIFREGDELPDASFLNQDGRPVSLSDYRGKSVALTFIYTRCPLPDYCIRMSQQFADMQRILKGTPALAGKWHLLSVSFDPRYDRPAVLKAYGRNYGADFGVWEFLTDADTSGGTLARFADGFGLSYAPSEGLIDHNLRTAVVDKAGRLVRLISGNEWRAVEVVPLLINN